MDPLIGYKITCEILTFNHRRLILQFMVASFEKRIWFCSVIGPVIALLCAALCGPKGGDAALPLTLVAIAGIPLSIVWRWRGLAAACALLLFVPIFFAPLPPHVAGLSLMMGIGFLLSVWGVEEAGRLVAREESEEVEEVEEESQVDPTSIWKERLAELQAILEGAEEESKHERGLRRLAQGKLEALERDRVQDTHRIRRMRDEISRLEGAIEEFKGLRQTLNGVRVELFQRRLDLQRLSNIDQAEVAQLRARQQETEKELFAARYALEEKERDLREKAAEPSRQKEQLALRLRAAREAILYLKGFEGRYRQLRLQFAEKQAELDRARRDLFHLEERLELESRREEEPSEVVESLVCEVEQLQETVSALFEELASRSCLSFREDFAALIGN